MTTCRHNPGLGRPNPSRREVTLVAQALHDSGDDEAAPLLNAVTSRGRYEGPEWDEIVRLATEAGATALVALDLVPEYGRPGMFARMGLA
jgi:hypothetical protein